jgi:uncharacterized protein YjbI with pentapeptide repeats
MQFLNITYKDIIYAKALLLGAHKLYLDEPKIRPFLQFDFSTGNLGKALLFDVNLDGALLIGAHLNGAYLTGAHMNGANLDDAHLNRAHLDGAHLDGVDLRNVHLKGAKITKEQLATMVVLDERDLLSPY